MERIGTDTSRNYIIEDGERVNIKTGVRRCDEIPEVIDLDGEHSYLLD